MFFVDLILPLFNTLTPLEDGELMSKIDEYSKKVDFPLKKIMVLDGSKRSSKANAFFSGLGKTKNICLYDTLINMMTTDEVLAVLAHEIGHFKKKHTKMQFFFILCNMFLIFYLMGTVLENKDLSAAMGS